MTTDKRSIWWAATAAWIGIVAMAAYAVRDRQTGTQFANMVAAAVLLYGIVAAAVWQLDRARRWTVRRVALYACLGGCFLCWWIAAADDANELMSRGQWRLVGWACLAMAAVLFFQQRAARLHLRDDDAPHRDVRDMLRRR
jgi:peptidoglycan/LPS O-acetylase OafA/YrhL